MRPERWQQIEKLFNSAQELPPGPRDAYLRDACGGDDSLRGEVERLLHCQADAEEFLEPPGSTEPPLPLTGRTFLHYQVAEKIGEGGMGVVYKAEDLLLGRAVALKFLSRNLAPDSHALERLQREARAASTLDHPHICRVYDIAVHDDQTFLVLEYLAGEPLAARLRKGPLPVAQALEIGAQIADALAAAHRHGIVHRDLKPGNVMLTKTGAKLLDFGLAKLSRQGFSLTPSASPPDPGGESLTVHGAILGTVPYMSPEQLEGRPVDARTDIWALGVMLYEMLAGKPAFEASSQAGLIAAILEHDPPPLATAQPLTPPLLDHLVSCCLAKNPEARWESAHDLAGQLRLIHLNGGVAAQSGGESRERVWKWIAAGALGAGCLAILIAALLAHRVEAPPRPSMRFSITLPVGAPLAPGGLMPQAHDRPMLALSPDGSRLAYVAQIRGQFQICVRDMTTGIVAPLAGAEGGHSPFFSPDGGSMGFFADGKMKRVSSAGGPAQVLTDAPQPYGGVWGTDGVIYFNRQQLDGLHQIGETGGPVDVVDTGLFRMPEFLEPGRGLLASAGSGIVLLARGRPSRFLFTGYGARYAPTGHLVYAVEGRLEAVPFDCSRLEVTGPAVSLLDDLRTAPYGVAQFTFGGNGMLVYASGRPQTSTRFVWVTRDGTTRPLALPERCYSSFDLSPDGTRLAFSAGTCAGEATEVWVHNIVSSQTARLTPRASLGSQANRYPRWAPDGRSVLYVRTANGTAQLLRHPVEGSAEPAVLWSSTSASPPYLYPMSFSPDGSTLVLFGPARKRSLDIFRLRLPGSGLPSGTGPELLLGADYGEFFGQISPDGRWLVYTSDQTSRNEIYVTSYPRPGAVYQVSRGGGQKPIWNPAAPEIVYRSGSQFYAASVSLGSGFRSGEPRLIFEGPYPNVPGFDFDISPDGRRLLLLKNEGFSTPSTTLNVITNFFELLRRRVPSRRGAK